MTPSQNIGNYDEEKREQRIRLAPRRTLPQMREAIEDSIRDAERRYLELMTNPFSDPMYLIVRRDNLIAAVALIESIEAHQAQQAAEAAKANEQREPDMP